MHQHSTDQLVCNNSGLSPKHAICHIRDSIVGVNRFKQSPIRSYCSQSKLLAQSLVLIDLNKRLLEANILNQNYQIQTNSNQELKHSRYKTHPKYAAPMSLLSRKGVLVGKLDPKKPSEFKQIYINSCLFLKIDPDTLTPKQSRPWQTFVIRTKNKGYLDPNVMNPQLKFVFFVFGTNLAQLTT